jgi:RNA polymerase sigma-70 factor (ECF subfamily)
MAEEPSFRDFLRRIRAGDQEAAAELVRRYEPAIRLEVRRRLDDPSLAPLFDSLDVCQSVLASFFVRAAAGQYDLDEEGQLLALLVGIARNKVAVQVRNQHRRCRDSRRRHPEGQDLLEACAGGLPPERQAAGRELLEAVRRLLTEEERFLADLRGEGLTWPQIADRVGGQAQARRRQLDRALDRVAGQLGLDEVDDA